MKKRLLSAFMALALCLTLLPTAALAEGTEGTAQTPPAVEEPADPVNGGAKRESQPAEQEEQQEDSTVKQAVVTVQAMIDALPDAAELDGMDDDDAMEVYEAFQTACDAYYDTLTEEQQAQLKNTEKLAALSDWFNAQVAPLEDSGDIFPDTVDADGSIIRDENWRRNGPICENSETDAYFTGDEFYVVQENDNVTIRGNLTIGGSCALILCRGATLTVEGALICSGNYSIYGQSDKGNNAGRLVIENSKGGGAAIRSSENGAPTLSIYSGELEIHSGNSDKLVDGVKLSSTRHIHQGTLDSTAVSPEVWGAVSLEGKTLTLAYCDHDNATYMPANQTQHTKHCLDCGFVGTAVACGNNGSIGYVSDGANGHYQKCPCGNKFGEKIEHTIVTAPTNDGKKHTSMCRICGYTPESGTEAEHSYDENGQCTVCHFQPILQGANGNLYDDLATALDEGETALTLVSYATGDANKSIVKTNLEFDRNATITLDMGGCTLENSTGGATLTVASGTLTVKGDATIKQTGSGELASSTISVTGGKVIFEGNLTATRASGKPAVEVTNGTLRLKAGDVLNGGVSVAGSTTYANVNALLGDGLAFAKVGEISAIVKGDVESISENVTVVAHTHDFKPGSDGKYVCACGYVCPHDKFENGVCTVCRNECAHKITESTDAAGNVTAKCTVCGAQMAVKSETGGTVTYGTDFKAAMRNATNGTKITLLADVSIPNRTGISGDNTTVTLDLNGHKITGGWLDVGNRDATTHTTRTLKIIGKGSYEPPEFGGLITVFVKATLDLSEWEGGTISEINISDNSTYDAETREPAVIVGPKAGTIGKLSFGNNQLGELKKTKLSGGSFNEIWAAAHQPVKLGDLLVSGYALQYKDGSYEQHTKTLQDESIHNVKVVKCLHPNMKPGEDGVATCEYCGKSGKFVASVDGNLYTDMDAAITYWLAKGGTLKLYTDYTAATEKATWTIVSGEHSIDLNGHSMFVQDDGAFKPTNNMHLTVTDDTERGQIENILLDGSQRGSFTLESGYVCNLEMTGGAVVALKGGSVDNLDVQNCSASTNLSIQGGSLGKLNITDWADGMHVSATGGSLGAYNLPSGKILADVLDHQYYAEGTSLDRQVDTAQRTEKFVIQQAPHDFGSTSKAANVPINGSIPFRVDSPSGDATGYYDVRWYRRTNSGAEHMMENRVAGVNVNDKLDVFCVITGADRPGGAMKWQVTVKDYTINVVPAMLNGATVTLDHDSFVFDGNSHTPTVTSVTLDNKALTNDDYTVSVDKKTNAGTYELIVNGKGNYTGKVEIPWTITKRIISVKDVTLGDKTYDGKVEDDPNKVTGVNFENLPDSVTFTKNTDYTIASVTYDSPNANVENLATVRVKLEGLAAVNYAFNADGQSYVEFRKENVAIQKADADTVEPIEFSIANGVAKTYTIPLPALPKPTAPCEYGQITYGSTPTVTMDVAGYYTDGAKVENGKLLLPIEAKDTEDTGKIGTVTITVSTTNYDDFPLTINVKATNKIVPTGEPTLSAKTLTYGQALSAIKLSGKLHDNVNNKDVEGMFTWADGTVKPSAGSYEAAWKFTPTDGDTYAETTGTVTITVNKAKPTGDPIYTRITAANKTLKDAALKPNASWPTGTIQWVDKDGKELENTTEVKANTAYKWIFTPGAEFAANYTTAEGTVILYSVSTGGGGGGSSSGSTVKTDTVTNPDGSVTKTETKKDGTKVETTTGKDGSVSQTTTNPNGSSVTETKAADGSTGTVKTDKNGQTTAETTLSSKAIETAKRNGEPVKAPVEVKATRNSDTAPTVKVELPKGAGETKVEIPVSNVKPGTVAVLVNPDGTEELLKDSIPTENGVQLTVNGGATVKIVDNSKDFIDTRNHWAKDAIDFVSARGLVNGISATIYAPNASTTRAQLWTILARQADADLTGGANWYEKAQAWSKEKGISDGANPNGTINRAQMVTMLWRAMGQPATASGASFADVPADAYYASAVSWAVENGITTGVGGGRFVPTATCTRAQIAAFLARSMK